MAGWRCDARTGPSRLRKDRLSDWFWPDAADVVLQLFIESLCIGWSCLARSCGRVLLVGRIYSSRALIDGDVSSVFLQPRAEQATHLSTRVPAKQVLLRYPTADSLSNLQAIRRVFGVSAPRGEPAAAMRQWPAC